MKTTLQALKKGLVDHRVSHIAERRKLHRHVDELYNEAARNGREIVGYRLTVQVRNGSTTMATHRTRTEDPAGMMGHTFVELSGWARQYDEETEIPTDPAQS